MDAVGEGPRDSARTAWSMPRAKKVDVSFIFELELAGIDGTCGFGGSRLVRRWKIE